MLTYYFRSFATNLAGTAYGPVVICNTAPLCPGAPSVTDIDGNSYPTVQIGSQCWMRENLKVSHYSTGTSLTYLMPDLWGFQDTLVKAYTVNNNGGNGYGFLYNWRAATNGPPGNGTVSGMIQGICPTGWHLPTDEEWKSLEVFLGMLPVQADSFGYRGNAEGSALKEATNLHWSFENTDAHNSSGFTAFAAGKISPSGTFNGFGADAYFWSSSVYNLEGLMRRLRYSSQQVERNYWDRRNGYSVRCIKGNSLGYVELGSFLTLSAGTGKMNASLISDGGTPPISRGFCWNTTGSPTVLDPHTLNTGSNTNWADTLTGLVSGADYFVSAYVINAVGTFYSQPVLIHFLDPCPGAGVAVDFDGNEYETILIGSQCWMRSNLRSSHAASGTEIPLMNSQSEWTSLVTPEFARCALNGQETNVQKYGYLYNWTAAVQGLVGSSANPSGLQGICPTGWHLPSDNEWKQLEMFLGMTQAQADATSLRGTNEGGEMKETGFVHWPSPNTGASNSSGFTGLPGGFRVALGDFYSNSADFWTSTEFSTNNAWGRVLYFDNPQVGRGHNSKNYAFSVRCVRNN